MDLNGDGDCDDKGETQLDFGERNVITDFDDDQQDRIVFHSEFEGTLSAVIMNNGEDIFITSSLGGSVIVRGLVNELEGLDPSSPFFNNDMLIDFLTNTGEDGDGKGVIYFEDKCIAPIDCDADQAVANCEVELPSFQGCIEELSTDAIGDTSISTTEAQIADFFVEEDANVWLSGNLLGVDLFAE